MTNTIFSWEYFQTVSFQFFSLQNLSHSANQQKPFPRFLQARFKQVRLTNSRSSKLKGKMIVHQFSKINEIKFNLKFCHL